jgi:site-specific DNA recombinase
MANIAIYARVSTTNGSQDYQRQISDLTRVILQHGHHKDDISIFAESISGYKKNTERPELLRMMNIIKTEPKHFKCIYVTETSRLGRNPGEVRDTIEQLIKLEVPLYVESIKMTTLNEDGSRNFVMNVVLQVLLEFAHAESEQLKQRSKSGLLESASKGKAGGGKNLAYGYAKDENKAFVIDESEAEVIKEIFDLYEAGNGIKVIAGILNSKGIKTRMNKAFEGQTIKYNIQKEASQIRWSDKQIHDIIRNPMYKGEKRFRGNLFKSPAIISKEQFDRCTEIREGKTHRNYLTTYTYLLKDLMICGCCGRNYFAKYKPVNGGDKVYICSSRLLKGGNCGNAGINISLIESAIYNQFYDNDVMLKMLSKNDDGKKLLQQEINNLENQLTSDTALLENKEQEKSRLLKVYLSGAIKEEQFVPAQEEIEDSLKSLTAKIVGITEQLRKQKSLLSRQSELKFSRDRLIEAAKDRNELRNKFKQFVSRVIINNIDDTYCLATLFIKMGGIEIQNSFKLLLEKKSVRKKPAEYSYVSLQNFSDWSEFIPRELYKNNILTIEQENLKSIMYKLADINESISINLNNVLQVE